MPTLERTRTYSSVTHPYILTATLLACVGFVDTADAEAPRDRFGTSGALESETGPLRTGRTASATASAPAPSEAPTGFDNVTNGYLPQGPDFDSIDEDTVSPLASFNDARFVFEEAETADDGLGPTYNAQSCRECHQNVVTGSGSQIAEHRTGRLVRGQFFESLGGSLIHSRATHADIVERVSAQDSIRTLRLATSTLGDGFVEAIANDTLLAIRNRQPTSIRGSAVPVPVLESNGQVRIGRFGWKSQHASLESFSADAYLNEMGITTPLLPDENTASGVFVGVGSGYDEVADPEDVGIDVVAFAEFMRSTKAPSRGPETAEVVAGAEVFNQVGCVGCHVASIATATPGTPINGGAFVVPEALGNKLIHPYGDFLMHDVGTGDGIPVQPGLVFAATARPRSGVFARAIA